MIQKAGNNNQGWFRILAPITLLVVLGGGLGGLAYQLSERGMPHALPEASQFFSGTTTKSPFSISQLHKRLPPKALKRVEAYIEYFQFQRRRGLEDSLSRSTRYVPAFKAIFKGYGLPEELAFLPIIESGYVNRAVSHAMAAGAWQFIPETGKRFNLYSNDWMDNRLDPLSSAKAAARYLKVLYKKFNSWELALAAYNAGAGTVRWARRVNKKAALSQDYWTLDLPEETQGYVPAFLAAVLMAKNPKAFGFHKVKTMPQLAFEKIKVSPGAFLPSMAQYLGVDKDTLLDLNPELIRAQVPPKGEEYYSLKTPPGTRKKMNEIMGENDQNPKNWMLHQVAQNDTLETLGAQFSTLPDQILKSNGILNQADLSTRSFIIIPL